VELAVDMLLNALDLCVVAVLGNSVDVELMREVVKATEVDKDAWKEETDACVGVCALELLDPTVILVAMAVVGLDVALTVVALVGVPRDVAGAVGAARH
jgi:hypothetical protein